MEAVGRSAPWHRDHQLSAPGAADLPGFSAVERRPDGGDSGLGVRGAEAHGERRALPGCRRVARGRRRRDVGGRRGGRPRGGQGAAAQARETTRQTRITRRQWITSAAPLPRAATTSSAHRVSAGASRRSVRQAVTAPESVAGSRKSSRAGVSTTTRTTANGRPAAAGASHADSMSAARAPCAASRPALRPAHDVVGAGQRPYADTRDAQRAQRGDHPRCLADVDAVRAAHLACDHDCRRGAAARRSRRRTRRRRAPRTAECATVRAADAACAAPIPERTTSAPGARPRTAACSRRNGVTTSRRAVTGTTARARRTRPARGPGRRGGTAGSRSRE